MGNADIGFFSTANHPIGCLFHILFKGLGIVSFLFLNAILGQDVLTFILVVLFAAFDFWTVKNVTGRILVNLRWWSEIDEHGNEKWIFESNDNAGNVGKTDSLVFWSSLYATPVVWTFFAFIDLISFKFFWLNMCVICVVLSSANVIGYYKCQKDH